MGALHLGHMALIERAAELADRVIVTIFVNPLQFNQSTDFDSYPRPIDDDLEACATGVVDAVYAPTAAAMYSVRVPDTRRARRSRRSARRAAAAGPFPRRHHRRHEAARGDATRRRGVRTEGLPAARHHPPHGARTSTWESRSTESRSARIRRAGDVESQRPPDARRPRRHGRTLAGPGHRRTGSVARRRRGSIRATVVASIAAEPRASLEYVEVVDVDTLRPVDRIDSAVVVLLAAWFGDVRLIDNRVLVDD